MNKENRMQYDKKAQEILASLTLEEKVSLMHGNLLDFTKASRQEIGALVMGLTQEATHYNVVPYGAGGVEKQGVPPVLFCDGPRGVVCGVGKSTCFPVTMARGATFDQELEEQIGHAIGKEVRAFGGNLFAGVCVNLPYHPGWGRSQETYGEESYAIGQMGAALTRGVQDEGIMACVKHFAFNQMENARFKVSVTCDQRTEKEVFLPHFKDCIDAGAASVMSAYNRYNGVMCGHHNYLLNEVLKGEWGFDGFVLSDFFYGVKDTVAGANGGQDVEMPVTHFFGDWLVKAVQDGFVPESRVNDAALRILRTVLAFDDGHTEHDASVLACPEHVALARRAAEESITLIKNEGVLPFDKETVHKLALIGKLAKAPNIGDYGSSRVRPPYVVTIEEGLMREHPDAELLYVDGSDIDEAKRIAEEADAVVFVLGYDHDDEGEFVTANSGENYLGAVGGDRKNGLGLHTCDVELLKAVSGVNHQTAVVLIGGNSILMTDWYELVPSILMAYYPGMEGGSAITEILYGAVNPSGRLPFVIPKHESDLPHVNWEAADQYYEYYHGYTRLDKMGVTPLIPYGFGLSYTSYAFSNLRAELTQEELHTTVTVSNIGKRSGDAVVQLYVGYPESVVDRPIRQLRGFARIALQPGERRDMTLCCPAEKLKYYEPSTREWIFEDTPIQVSVGSSSAPEDLITVTVIP